MPYVPYRKTYKRRSYPKKATKPMYKKKYSSYKKPSVTTVKKIVKRAIDRNVENKTLQWYSESRVDILPSNGTNFLSTIEPVSLGLLGTPVLTIPQGTGQGQRIGNRIKIKSAYIAGTIFPNVYDVTTNPVPQPCQVILWLFYDRSDPTNIPNPVADFFQKGNTTVAMSGDLQDIMSPVNTDKYRVLTKRVFKIGYANVAGTGANAANENFANNDFKLNRNFKIPITKYLIKNVKFNDNATLPMSRGLFMMITAVASNGSLYSAGGVPAQMFWNVSYTYEDA